MNTQVNTNRLLWRWITLLIVGFFVVFMSIGVSTNNNLYIFCSVATLPLLFPALYQYFSGEPELFNPINFIFLNFLLGGFLQSIALSFSYNHSSNLPISVDTDIDLLISGALAMSAASLFLIIGYAISSNRKASSRKHTRSTKTFTSRSWSKSRLVSISLFCAGITVLSLVYYINALDVLSDLTKLSVKRNNAADAEDSALVYLARFGMRFGQVASIAVFAFHLVYKREHRAKRSGLELLMYFLFAISIVGPIIASSRSSLLFYLIGLFAVHNFVGQNWKIKHLRTAALLTVAIIVIMGGVRYVQQRSVSVNEFQEEVGFSGSAIKLALSNSWTGVAKTSVVMSMVPNTEPHTYGTTYLLWALAPIPRSMWPEKPIIRIGGLLGSAVFGTRESNGIPPGFIGEAWLNFGLIGVPFVSFILGIALRRYFDTSGRQAGYDLNKLLIYASTFTIISFSLFASDFSGGVTRIIQILLPAFLIIYFVKIKTSR